MRRREVPEVWHQRHTTPSIEQRVNRSGVVAMAEQILDQIRDVFEGQIVRAGSLCFASPTYQVLTVYAFRTSRARG